MRPFAPSPAMSAQRVVRRWRASASYRSSASEGYASEFVCRPTNAIPGQTCVAHRSLGAGGDQTPESISRASGNPRSPSSRTWTEQCSARSIRLSSARPAQQCTARPSRQYSPRFRPNALSRCYHTTASPSSDTSPTSHKTAQLSAEQEEFLNRALRVNQAGELAATLIYAGQTPPIVRAHPHLRPLMRHMAAQEEGHLKTFDSLLARHRVRPTALRPLWNVAATTLGWATGLAGRRAAMACTEAVEMEIGTHYNDQVREILRWEAEMQARGEQMDPQLRELVDTLKRIRDEELEHLDIAVDHEAKEAEAYPVLTSVIRGGCRGAIWLSERI